MTDLTTAIGAFDADLRSVPVTFTSGDIVFERSVNAVLASDGTYDEAGTAERVAEVGRGVSAKIALGVISADTQKDTAATETENAAPTADAATSTETP